MPDPARRVTRTCSRLALPLALVLAATGAHAETLRFRVMSYNVAAAMCGNPMPGGGCLFGDPTPQMTKLAAMIQSNQIDVVGLQEVERGTARHGGKDMLALLVAELDRLQYPMDHRWVAVWSVDGGQHGQATLSRWPIRDFVSRAINPGNAYVDTVDMTAIEVPGRQATELIRVFNYHPSPLTSCSSTDPGYLDFIRGSGYLDGTSFLVGDYNLGRSASCYPRIVETHADCCLVGGDPSCQCTVDLSIRTDIAPPCGAIDYVFHRFGTGAGSPFRWALTAAHVDQGANNGTPISDHFPVVAEFSRCTQDCVPGQTRCSTDGVLLCVDSAGCGAWGGATPCETRVGPWSSPACDGDSRVIHTRSVEPGTCQDGQCTGPQSETEVVATCATGSTCQGGECVVTAPTPDAAIAYDASGADRSVAGDASTSSAQPATAPDRGTDRTPGGAVTQTTELGDGLSCSSGENPCANALLLALLVIMRARRQRRGSPCGSVVVDNRHCLDIEAVP